MNGKKVISMMVALLLAALTACTTGGPAPAATTTSGWPYNPPDTFAGYKRQPFSCGLPWPTKACTAWQAHNDVTNTIRAGGANAQEAVRTLLSQSPEIPGMAVWKFADRPGSICGRYMVGQATGLLNDIYDKANRKRDTFLLLTVARDRSPVRYALKAGKELADAADVVSTKGFMLEQSAAIRWAMYNAGCRAY